MLRTVIAATTRSLVPAVVTALASVGTLATIANADAFVQEANALAAPPSGVMDATTELFPALAAMDPSPFRSPSLRSMLMPSTTSPEWPGVAAWLAAPAQRAALEAVKKVTDPAQRYMIGLPYGAQGVDSSWVEAGLYVELGKGDLLAGAKFHYLDRVRLVLALCGAAATDAASNGDAAAATDGLIAALRFSRMLSDREFAAEKFAGMEALIYVGEKICDVVYTFPDSFDATALANLIDRFEERRLYVERIRLPQANRIAANQLIERTIEPRGNARPDRMATTMSRVDGADRPLLRFNHAAHWAGIAASQAGWFDTKEKLEHLYGDWQRRWDLADLHDPLHGRLSDYRKMDKRRYLILHETVGAIEQAFMMRMTLLTQLGGTRSALAVTGFKARNRVFPPTLPAVQPTFIQRLDADPFSIEPRFRNMRQNPRAFRRYEKSEIFEYFVPIRDQRWGPREQPIPYEIEVIAGSENSSTVGAADDVDPDALMRAMIGPEMSSNALLGSFAVVAGEQIGTIGRFVDVDRWTIDVDGLREYLLSRNERPEEFEADQEATKASIQSAISAGLTPDTASAWFDGVWTQIIASAQAAPGEVFFGIDPQSIKGPVSGIIQAAMSPPQAREVFDTVRTGGPPSIEQIRLMQRAMIEAGFTSELINPLFAELRPLAGTPIGRALRAARRAAEDSFKTSFDDSVFILYSVGPDQRDDEARRVVPSSFRHKPSGTDILIWPPIISLERNHYGG